MANSIELKIADGVANLRIDRPERRNALDNDAIECFLDCLARVRRSSTIALVISGEGTKAFCAGSDLKALSAYSAQDAEYHTYLFQKLAEEVDELPCATIAAIEGACLGGGLEIALGCDYRISADNSRLGFPEITVGALPTAGGTVRAPRAIGLARTREMMLFGEPVDPVTALQWGLISQVAPAGTVVSLANEKATTLARTTNRDTVMLLKTMLVSGAGLAARPGQSLAYLGDFALVRSESFQKGVAGWKN
jgi:enoyl-CoA hydratase/carnithine racemase